MDFIETFLIHFPKGFEHKNQSFLKLHFFFKETFGGISGANSEEIFRII